MKQSLPLFPGCDVMDPTPSRKKTHFPEISILIRRNLEKITRRLYARNHRHGKVILAKTQNKDHTSASILTVLNIYLGVVYLKSVSHAES